MSSRYPTYYSSNGGCGVCHGSSGTSLPNAATQPYGFAFKTAVVARGGRNATNAPLALADIEPLDSDGDGYRNIIEINSLYKAYDPASKPTASVSLSTSSASKTGAASSTVSYAVTLTNNGNITDSFTLGVSVTSGQSWAPSIVGTASNVTAGGTASLTINIAIPGGATTGQSSVATVTAVSQANTGVAATPLALTTSIPAVAAVARYVNAASGNNTSNSCTNVASPCRTITYAMAQATAGAPGDAINVAPGTYNVALGEVFPIVIKSGVQLFATGATANTIVDAAGNSSRVFNVSAANASTLIEGLTITGGLHTAPGDGNNTGGGAMLITNSSLIRIRRNVFTGNTVRGFGGVAPSFSKEAYGGAIMTSGGSPTIENNVFSANTAWGGDGTNGTVPGGDAGGARGGAISGGAAIVVNNTFHGNVARGGAGGSSSGQGGAGGLAFTSAVDLNGATFANNIFTSNLTIAGTAGSGSPNGSPGNAIGGALVANAAVSNTNNLFFGNTSNGDTGTAPVFLDPAFHSAPSNLRIQVASPANGAGTATGAPSRDFDARVRASPPSIGAFQASALAGGSAPDLVLGQSSNPAMGNVGKDLVFTLTVNNAGTGAATGVALSNALPAGATFVWATSGCANAAGTVTCSVGSLAAGASVQLKIVVRATSAGVATNTASVTASQSDASAGNNTSSLGVTINSTPAATAINRYRLYSDVTKEHHFTTDLNEYNVLGTYVGTWVQEGTVGKVLNNPGAFNAVTATPYYRLYNTASQWHHWTTDANEYYTLVQFPGWNGEGVDGYILPTSTAGAIQLYRLNYPALGALHHWTIDANEYNTLITPAYGWVGEGGSGFVIQ
ncbi:MAG TPA: DUF1565 domain-containing protein [Usitatibacter sp.]|nr:DUF1565 domain-containing protein [Usitatibacter sp.]